MMNSAQQGMEAKRRIFIVVLSWFRVQPWDVTLGDAPMCCHRSMPHVWCLPPCQRGVEPRKVNMKQRLICALWCVLIAGCTSSAPPHASSSATVSQATLVPSAAFTQTLARVPVIRDRPWKTPLKLVGQDASTLASTAPLPSSSLGPFLGLDLTPTPWPLDALAVLKHGEVHYAARHTNSDALERAVFFAAVQALDAQYLSKSSTAAPRNTLAEHVSRKASALFALSLWEIQGTHPRVSMETLAQRPELVWQANTWVSKVLKPKDSSWGAHLNAGQAKLGLGLASVMARAQGWNGVDLLQAQSPQDVLGLMQPAPWMEGQDPAQWTWSAAWLKAAERQGWIQQERALMGPLVLEYWLTQHPQVSPQVAATLPLGLQAQDAQIFVRSKGRALVWMMQWKTPHWANEAAGLFEAISKTYAVKGHTMEVKSEGLLTILTVRPTAQPWVLEGDMMGLLKTQVRYPASNRFALAYRPSLLDRVLAGAKNASFKDGLWTDPDVGLRADVAFLGDAWKVQANTKGALRWYAKADDGMIQLSIDVHDPLGPQWGTPQSIDAISTKLLKALPQSTLTHKKAITHPLGKGFELVFTSPINGTASTWSIWIVEYDGMLITFSASSSTASHGTVSQHAARIFAGLQGTHGARPKTPGHIEIQVDP